jgi:hypothetical protein
VSPAGKSRHPSGPADAPDPSGAGPRGGRTSALLLLWLRGMPRWLVAMVLILIAVAGLALPGLAGACLLGVILALLTWLAVLSWPVATGGGRVLRLAALAAVTYGIVVKFVQ